VAAAADTRSNSQPAVPSSVDDDDDDRSVLGDAAAATTAAAAATAAAVEADAGEKRLREQFSPDLDTRENPFSAEGCSSCRDLLHIEPCNCSSVNLRDSCIERRFIGMF
jgi:hypothetical protein